MGLLDLLGMNRLPDGVRGTTMVVGDAAALGHAGAFLDALAQKFGALSLAVAGPNDIPTRHSVLKLPTAHDKATALIRKAAPGRLVLFGSVGGYAGLASVECPKYWVNATLPGALQAGCRKVMVSDPKLTAQLPGAAVTGDPAINLDALPAVAADTGACMRFKEQREGGRWLGYFAGTGEGEEEIAYPLFNRLIRHKMGVMLLAPRDQARCEPVYRESIKYRLQTIRHNRLSTSFVPIKTRVYYVEEPEPLAAMYACADFVIVGGTLRAGHATTPDLLTPMLHGKPVIVGPAQRELPLIKAAVAAGAVRAAENEEDLFEQARQVLDDPDGGAKQAAEASKWLELQVGALGRVLALID
jgi:3-deoxy-D-manno-octulosonic-acid transferase